MKDYFNYLQESAKDLFEKDDGKEWAVWHKDTPNEPVRFANLEKSAKTFHAVKTRFSKENGGNDEFIVDRIPKK